MAKATPSTTIETTTNTNNVSALEIANRNGAQASVEVPSEFMLTELKEMERLGLELKSQTLPAISPTQLATDETIFNLLDCFMTTLTIDGEEKDVICYIGQKVANAENVFRVTQTDSNIRNRFARYFEAAKATMQIRGGAQPMITNCKFIKLEKGGKAGNKPIVLTFTADTKMI